ncbi:hypothetical protein MLD38_026127 [Melastoma candidum]|uniref:Uncharacterized protein n=1 Tax=Melastoma candidum TaxID=119954 RepID=A0ACB9NXL7_9MYRT|nr:hypothetical protein MLD38_026127 [Melastoma candidum]
MFSPLRVCMDSSDDWLQGTLNDDVSVLMDSSSSPSGDMLTCSRPLMERRLRPQHDQPLKCPRCDSAHTKFCYYNNYSLSQPRYFCKTCRRYWTKGGTLRNIPVGGGCRKNKKVSSSSSSSSAGNGNNAKSKFPILTGPDLQINQQGISASSLTDLHLSYSPDVQLSQLSNMIKSANADGTSHGAFGEPAMNFGFTESKYSPVIDLGHSGNPPAGPIDFMVGGDHPPPHTNNQIHQLGLAGDVIGVNPSGFHGICSPFGIMPLEGHPGYFGGSRNSLFIENFQKLMLPYNQGQVLGNEQGDSQNQTAAVEVKPNSRMLSLEWQQDHNCSTDAGKNAAAVFGYFNGLGSSTWPGGMMMNDYNSSAASANPLV